MKAMWRWHGGRGRIRLALLEHQPRHRNASGRVSVAAWTFT